MGGSDPRTVLVALWRMSRPAQIVADRARVHPRRRDGARAGATAEAGAVALGLAALLPVAASVHYANEYADVETDADACYRR
ncbi:hypothetical protein [Halorubrum kocurii]|uniref:1,4-dihydroxy-2-naphthoate octaprenyltransferase n=1 Tax=Halorubrum kocurii JCM 14978 TaxID=1230456 RepID=M0PBR4_9EURY|nr:hypothetical protein [Halorubrum kocurii]EMA66275.1 1,4-dihydroxy-2-naphthoate octaprenyltransferase [Halorubrum kocurii JCM 14978]